MSKKGDKQVIKDEADAELREGARQAKIDRDIAMQAVNDAAEHAAREATAAAAKETFGTKLRHFLRGWDNGNHS